MTQEDQLRRELVVMIDAAEAARGDVGAAIERGRNFRRRKNRIRLSLVAASVALALGGGAALQFLDLAGSQRRLEESPGAPAAQPTTEQLVSACRDGNQSQAATEAIFGEGDPHVEVLKTVAESVALVLSSSDGEYWADCYVNLYGGTEFHSGMVVYGAQLKPGRRQSGVGYSTSFACHDQAPERPCDDVVLKYVDRVGAPVAAVEFVTADGITTRVPTVNGFVLFFYQGSVPGGLPQTMGDLAGKRVDWILRVTYVDVAGRALAASNFGPGNEQIDGLPPLREYPSHRSAHPIGQQIEGNSLP